MKRLLQLSLLLNVVLLSIAAWRSTGRTPPPVAPTEQREPAKPALKRTVRPGPNTPAAKMPWNKIESTDPAQYIANLRAIGCPEQTIRDLVLMRVCRQFRDRLLAAEAEVARAWDYTRQRSQESWNESNRQRQELRDEMISTVESLLGENWGSIVNSLMGWPEPGDDPMGALSLEKRRQVRAAEGRYQLAQQVLDSESLQTRGQDDGVVARMRELEKQRRAELAGILSPSELEEYLYRRSAAADYVRENLPAAKSEAEFRAMVKLADEMGMTRPPPSMQIMDPADADSAAARDYNQHKAAFEQRLKELLGEQRVAEQQAAEQARSAQEGQQDREQAEQREMARLTDMAVSVGVPAESAARFMSRLKELEPILKPKFEEMEKNLTCTPEEKKKQMEAAVRAELEKIAVETMGEKGRDVVEKLIESGH